MNNSLFSCGRPEKYTFVRKSFRKRAKVLVGLRFNMVGTGQNFRPNPMTDRRLLGRLVEDNVKSWSSRLSGREK